MKLTVLDRIQLLNILPKEGDFRTLKVIRDLQNELSFSEEEHTILQFKQDGELLNWNPMGDKEVAVGEKATDIIVDTLKKLDETKTLKAELVDLYEKFV